jgi:peptide/nickel transport system substrate-binding protein
MSTLLNPIIHLITGAVFAPCMFVCSHPRMHLTRFILCSGSSHRSSATHGSAVRATFTFVLLAVVVLIIVAGGCARPSRNVTTREGKGGVRLGGMYRVNMLRGNPSGLDPVIITSKLADDIAMQIFDRLITFDSNLVVQPELATSWDISGDGLRYTFHLRSDVKFHNNVCFPSGIGRKLVASDVIYSLSRCCDTRARSAAFWVFKDKVLGANEAFERSRSLDAGVALTVRGIQAPNDSTVIITLARPYSPFLLQLSNALGCVVPAEAVNYYGKDFFRHPVGSGPFRFVSWKDDHELVLERNPEYWEVDESGNRLPYLDNIRFSFITDDKVQFQEFVAGNLEESFSIPNEIFPVLFNIETKQPRKAFPFVIQQRPAMLTWFIDFLCTRPPFDNADVRRAFSYAVDREKLVRYVLRNAPYSAANYGITPPVMAGYNTTAIQGISFKEETAREYLRKAGYPDGKGFPEVTLSVYPEPRLLQTAEAVQAMLTQTLNVKIKLQVIQFAQLLDMAEAGKLSMWGTRWYGDYPDVENYLSLLDGSLVPTDSTQPSYPNSTRYNNNSMNTLLAKAVATVDDSTRLKLYTEAEKIATADAPCLLLFYEMHYRLLQPHVRNYPLDAMNRMYLKRVWFSW